jgi:excisionase family DNA binding protein
MTDLLTTRQVQELLQVDRITVYRMLQDGRLKGVKIGQQWRFPIQEVEQMLRGAAPVEAPQPSGPGGIFPVHCVQTIQDLFSEVALISALVIDMEGQQVTRVSQPNPFYNLLVSTASGQMAMQSSLQGFARDSAAGGKYFTCCAGLQYIGAPILEQDNQVGVFLAGQFYWQPPDPREEADRLRRLAAAHGLPLEELRQAAGAVPVIQPGDQARVENWPLTAARAIHSILRERSGFMQRLQKIANLTQVG